MKLFSKFIFVALLTSCASPTPPPRAPTPLPEFAPVRPPAFVPKTTPTPPPQPGQKTENGKPKHPLKVRTASLNGTIFTAVTFDRRDYSLKVIDQEGGPGSQFSSAEEAGQGSLAAINGGFFNPDGSPLGLVITSGEVRGSLNNTSFLGTGILDGQNVTLATRKTYQKSSELLQSGPRLVWAGETLTGLSSNNDRPRSLLIWDGKNHFGLVHANSATLQGLSNNLKSQPINGFNIQYALNLDGGRSCDLWISEKIPGGGMTKKSFLNKNVRNYLALRKR